MSIEAEVHQGRISHVNRNDSRQFGDMLGRFAAFYEGLAQAGTPAPKTTLVFDKGNNSADRATSGATGGQCQRRPARSGPRRAGRGQCSITSARRPTSGATGGTDWAKATASFTATADGAVWFELRNNLDGFFPCFFDKLALA